MQTQNLIMQYQLQNKLSYVLDEHNLYTILLQFI